MNNVDKNMAVVGLCGTGKTRRIINLWNSEEINNRKIFFTPVEAIYGFEEFKEGKFEKIDFTSDFKIGNNFQKLVINVTGGYCDECHDVIEALIKLDKEIEDKVYILVDECPISFNKQFAKFFEKQKFNNLKVVVTGYKDDIDWSSFDEVVLLPKRWGK